MHYRQCGHKRVVKRAMNVLYFASRPPYQVNVGLPSVTNAQMVKISVSKYRRTFHNSFTNPNRTKSRAKGRLKLGFHIRGKRKRLAAAACGCGTRYANDLIPYIRLHMRLHSLLLSE